MSVYLMSLFICDKFTQGKGVRPIHKIKYHMWRLQLEYRPDCTRNIPFYNSSILVSAGDIIGTTGSWEFFVACTEFCILTVTATYKNSYMPQVIMLSRNYTQKALKSRSHPCSGILELGRITTLATNYKYTRPLKLVFVGKSVNWKTRTGCILSFLLSHRGPIPCDLQDTSNPLRRITDATSD